MDGIRTAGGNVATSLRARRRTTITSGAAALVVALTLVASACSSSGSSGNAGGSNNPSTTPTTSGKAVKGGSVVWALPAESSGGWCLPEAQLAISGEQVARAIYDTLTVPNDKEQYVGMLAESVTANPTNTQWTIKLRPNIKFSDGTALDATVVKNNLDAYRGTYPNRQPLLFKFVFGAYVKNVTVVDPMTVQVDTVPWTAFRAYLYGAARVGIMAQSQLDDKTSCASKLVGTGPFTEQSWKRNDSFVAVRNPNYWRKDKDGVQLPYLDKITFKPIVESAQMVNGIQSGNISLALDDGAINIVQYRSLAAQHKIQLTESQKFPELAYTLFNVTVPPFNNINARLAVAYGVNRVQENKLRNKDVSELAQGPFGPGVMGYLKDSGFPTYNPTKAKEYVQKYKDETGKKLTFTYLSPGTDPEGLKTIGLIKTYMSQIGVTMGVKTVDESQGINDVIGKQFQATAWRNHAGFDPDTEFVWWHCDNKTGPCDNLVNFGAFNDPVINQALEDGRSATDVAQRTKDYETINRQFAKQVYDAWGWYSDWTIPAQNNVHGIGNLPLLDGSAPFPGFTSGIDPAGVWVSQ
jgi:peptide/nickel transport system substrate-binding protein